jgi:hypothetical protein
MAYLTASGHLVDADALSGDDYLRYLTVRVRQRDREEDGTGIGTGGHTEYHLSVYGVAAEALDRIARAGELPLLTFGGRYAIRHLENGSARHEVAVDYIGLDLEGFFS